jgi:ribonucrease Y
MDILFVCFIFALGWGVCHLVTSLRLGTFRQQAMLLLHQAEKQAEEKKIKLLEACAETIQTQKNQVREETSKLESDKEEQKLERKKLKSDLEDYRKRVSFLEKKEKEFSKAHVDSLKTLENIANLTLEEARAEVWQRAEAESKKTLDEKIHFWQKIYEKECGSKAHSLLFSALERKTQSLTKDPFLVELSVSEDLIPRLIGKDGRNIHMLEDLLGSLLIVDENEKKVLISVHDPKKRMIARATIEKVISTDKITPVTIRDAYESVIASFPHLLEKTGREACAKVGIASNMPSEILRTLGELSLRSSAGQNVLLHSLEVAELMNIITKELGLCSEKAKLMGFLHDIGKALSTDWGTTHAMAGKAFLLAHNIDSDVVNAVASHHGEELFITPESRLIPICDRLSAQLPGLRKAKDNFVLDLIHTCEEVAKNAPHVLSAWAHYAGDHIELLVRPDTIATPESLLPHLEKSLHLCKLRLPIKITLTSFANASTMVPAPKN